MSTPNLIVTVDGIRHEISSSQLHPNTTLLELLREHLGNTCAKEGCGEGGCGACTVMLDHSLPVMSCLLPAFVAHQRSVATAGSMHRLGRDTEEALIENGAVQCGFCSPGMLVSLCASSGVKDIEESLDGVLCRCTGYRPMIAAAACTKKREPSVVAMPPVTSDHHFICSDGSEWFLPASLPSLIRALQPHGRDVRMVGGKTSFPAPQLLLGNTDLAYRHRYHPLAHERSIHVCAINVAEMAGITAQPEFLCVGAGVSIERLREALLDPRWTNNVFAQFSKHLRFFANFAVRSFGTVGGSVVACDPLSDLLPPLRVLHCELCILSSSDGASRRVVPVGRFIDNQSERLKNGEILLEIRIPFAVPERILLHKVAKRKSDAQALVSAAFSPSMACFSGVTTKPAFLVEAALEMFSSSTQYAKHVTDAIQRHYQVDGFRSSVIGALAKRFFSHDSASGPLVGLQSQRASIRTIQGLSDDVVREIPSRDPAMDAENRSLLRGEHKFVADLPMLNQAHGVFACFSSGARGSNLSIDVNEASSMPGVITIVTAADFDPQRLRLGTVVLDEEVLASGIIEFFGQPVALVVARSRREAHEAARMVHCRADLQDPVHGIMDAVQKQSFFPALPVRRLSRFGQEGGLLNQEDQTVLQGEFSFPGQEHMYLEPQAVQVHVQPSGRVFCRATCQNPSRVQWAISHVLHTPLSNVQVIVDRIGGGFGGKQDRPQFIAAAAAVASRKAGCVPVSIVLDRETDMVITGQRHPFHCRYKAVLCGGRIESVEVEAFADGGFSVDLSLAVLEVFLFALDGCYYIPKFEVSGRVCRTNRPSNTAFRGFGKPQATGVIERIFEECAAALHVSADDLRQRHVYRAGQPLLSGFPVSATDLPYRLLGLLLSSSDYVNRRAELERFNASSQSVKRGLAFVVTKNNTGFDVDFMNQASASVLIYKDGSVLVHMAGTEMGQGLRAKLKRIVAFSLGGLDPELVRIEATDTNVIINSSPTAATTGTDLNGRACQDACQQLLERLRPFEGAWQERCNKAYESKIQLQATGFGTFENFAYNFGNQQGDWSYYYIYGACAAEVEIDCLTGEWSMVRVDIVQDVGSSALNGAIDVGQLEGGFMQGVGLYTMEDLVWAADGHLRSRNVSTYKIPSIDDTPADWRIRLVEANDDRTGILGSKTVGEAGVQHASAVWVALSRAVRAAGGSDLLFPATVQNIQRACQSKC